LEKYAVRPSSGNANPEATKNDFCIYDEPHKDCLYTQAWVTFLTKKMADENEYISLFKKT